MTSKTAVLILGFHLDSTLQQGPDEPPLTWHDLVIGQAKPCYDFGRATYGVQLAYQEGADTVFFSTGASERDGLKEAEYTYRRVLDHAGWIGAGLSLDAAALRAWLEPRVRLDVESQTTAQELRRNLTWCARNDHWRVFIVTSRFHVPRALRDANNIRDQDCLGGMRIYGSAPEDDSVPPVIFEPCTRPDRPFNDWHGVLGRIFSLPADQQARALSEIEAILAAHQR